MGKNTVRLKIRRQDGPNRLETRRWEQFRVELLPRMSVIDALEQIRLHPVTIDGTRVAPVVWECACLEEACGACSMRINGRVRQACSALIEQVVRKEETIVLEPMTKFPVVRDLMVDRSRVFDDLVKVGAWVEIDGTHPLGPGPRETPERQRERYALARCILCGCCLEACPQYNDSTRFVGAAVINEARLLNLHPTGARQAAERIDRLMRDGGIADCGKAQNCVQVCPKDIPLLDSLAGVARDATKRLFGSWLLR